jgi:hypothetical protein
MSCGQNARLYVLLISETGEIAMRNWLLAAVAAAAVTGGYDAGASVYVASFGRHPAPEFIHEFRCFHGQPRAASRGWGLGRFGAGRFAENGELAGDGYRGDYDDSYDPGLNALHFRVQEPFGPGDIGRPQPPQWPPDPQAW